MLETLKTCTRCKVDKSQAEFHKDATKEDGHRTQCKECTRTSQRIRPPKSRKHGGWRKFHYKSEYGITTQEYDRLFNMQGGCCAICASMTPGKGRQHFCVDHCHLTGSVRALLCFKCNVLLGLAKDCPRRLEAAADYLRKHHGDGHQSDSR